MSHTQSPGSPGAPNWPPREKRFGSLAVDGAPSAGHQRKCLLDCLSLMPLILSLHWRNSTMLQDCDYNQTEESPGADKERDHWRWRKETGLGVRQTCVQTPALSLCALGPVNQPL